MEQRKISTAVAGVDVGKRTLDAAVYGSADLTAVDNTVAGIGELIAWLKAREVGRVGLEATGGYEKTVRLALEAQGFEVVVHQPLEVRLFARLKRFKAKTDRMDAQLIAAATANTEAVKAAQDPRLAEHGHVVLGGESYVAPGRRAAERALGAWRGARTATTQRQPVGGLLSMHCRGTASPVGSFSSSSVP